MTSPTNLRAVVLSGSLGLGHEMLMRSCGALLDHSGWQVRGLDCMELLGRRGGAAGHRVFNRMVGMLPGIYDGLHFAHLRTGSPLAKAMDAGACSRLVPALRTELEEQPAELVLSVFATGASAAAKLKAEAPQRRTVVLCTDVTLHRLWVAAGTDLFLTTSPAAAASVWRYLPKANVAVVPPPVRPIFYEAPSREQARAELLLDEESPCVLLIDSGWGFGPLVESVQGLAAAGIEVLAVAGRRADLEARFRAIAASVPRVHAFGFVDDVPALMAAADLIVALPGATTCSEARVVGRPVLLLDVMPGHGRENLLHELETGGARACGHTAGDIVAGALAMLERPPVPLAAPPRWEVAFATALRGVGLDVTAGPIVPRPSGHARPAGGEHDGPAVAPGAPCEPREPLATRGRSPWQPEGWSGELARAERR